MPIGASANPTGQPIGGGAQPWVVNPNGGRSLHRYEWIPEIPAGTCFDWESLDKAIQNAAEGEVVYVEDDAEIWIGKGMELVINTKIILASGRGRRYMSLPVQGRDPQERESQGAMLYANNDDGFPVIRVNVDGVRISGLRIRGPRQEATNGVQPRRAGVKLASGKGNLEVDNCELYGWTQAAIYIEKKCRKGIHIHHNHIHNNLGAGTGYGVSLDAAARATIECNLFNDNRHAIMGSGGPDCGYVARFNVVKGGATGHLFDMHGDIDGNDGKAGRDVYIHNNTFLVTETSYGWPIPAIKIRGVTENCVIESNLFSHDTESKAVLIHKDNHGDVTRGNSSGLGSVNKWWISGGEVKKMHCSNWTEIARSQFDLQDLGFGDFTGDGLTDAFRTDGSHWWVAKHAREQWNRVYKSKLGLHQLAFGRFVSGNPRTHMFWPDSSNGDWYVFQLHENGDVSKHQLPYGSRWTVDKLRFWDINGNGETDVFKLQDGRGYVSWGARTQWEKLTSFEGATIEDLASGVFLIDGNKIPGILYADGRSMWVYPSGRGPRKKLMTSKYTVRSLVFGDFFGMGCTCIGRRKVKDKNKIIFAKPAGEHYQWEPQDDALYRACKPAIGELRVGRFRRPDKDELFAVSHKIKDLPW